MRGFDDVQGSDKRRSPGLVKFVIVLAYQFCMAFPAAFTQPGDHLLAEPCKYGRKQSRPASAFDERHRRHHLQVHDDSSKERRSITHSLAEAKCSFVRIMFASL